MEANQQTHVVFEHIQSLMSQAAIHLTADGLPSEWYMLPNCSGYAPVTGEPTTDVYCLEARLGPTHQRPGYSSYAVAQIFHPHYPSMVLILMISRRDEDGALDPVPPVYNPGLDKVFSSIFLRQMQTAFNSLDPGGQNKGLLVQSYQASITLSDIPQATIASTAIVLRFKEYGQLACIAVDFADPFTKLVATLLSPLKSIRNMHFIPRTAEISAIQIPLRSNGDEPYHINDNSMSLDRGFHIAMDYFEQHYHQA